MAPLTIQLLLTPADATLQCDITIALSVSSGSATGTVHGQVKITPTQVYYTFDRLMLWSCFQYVFCLNNRKCRSGKVVMNTRLVAVVMWPLFYDGWSLFTNLKPSCSHAMLWHYNHIRKCSSIFCLEMAMSDTLSWYGQIAAKAEMKAVSKFLVKMLYSAWQSSHQKLLLLWSGNGTPSIMNWIQVDSPVYYIHWNPSNADTIGTTIACP